MDQLLREKLQFITLDLHAHEHAEKISALRLEHPHSISVLPSYLDEPLEDYNCVMYALDLVARMQEPCRPFGRFYADTEFLKALVKNGVLKPSSQLLGNIVTWSDDEKINHIGIVTQGNMATSKWGIGNLYEHEFHEVPDSYGCNLDFYEPVEFGIAFDMLSKYLARKL